MSVHVPVRLGPAELKLIEQLTAAGATAEAERFATAGLPTRKVESYHYTDLKQLLRVVPEMAGIGKASAAPFALENAYRATIVNGRVGVPESAPGVHAHRVAGSPLAMRDDDIVTRLNMGLAGSSLALALSGAPPVVVIDRRSEGAAGHSASGARVFVADDVEATLVETISGSDAAHLTNHGTAISVGRNARLTHVAVDLSGRSATTFSTYEFELAEGAQLRTLTLNAGSALSRSNIIVRFAGSGAHADLTGLNLVGEDQHCDITLEATHAVPKTSCKPLYKQVGRGHGKAVFQGKLVVARHAQKTDAKLMTQGLMLTDDAEILTKPELEIFADDVVCGHGSTCGALDETAMFYLMSRGIDRVTAEAMLVRAFLAEVIEPVTNDGLREALTGVVEGWLAGSK